MVAGGSSVSEKDANFAYLAGKLLVREGFAILCGGRGGVMEYVAKGAREEGGFVVCVLPGLRSTTPPNKYCNVSIFTGMGQARNVILVVSSCAVLAIGGKWGTLSEIALARKHEVPVITLHSWNLGDESVITARDPYEAVRLVKKHARLSKGWEL